MQAGRGTALCHDVTPRIWRDVLITTVLSDGRQGEPYWTAVLYGPYAILTGLFIVRFPFSTPETVKWLGLAKSRLLARGLGWLFAGIGVWILATGPW